MRRGISPVVATVLLIAIAVIASVTSWYWVSSYTAKPAIVETTQKGYVVTAVYRNLTSDGCAALAIKNNGGATINNLVLELRDYVSGEQAGTLSTYLTDPGLVSYWGFDEAIGNWTGDGTTRGNNGTYYGESLYNGSLIGSPDWVEGKYGTALYFNGINECIGLPNSSEIQPYPFSLSAWFKTTSQASNGMVFRWRFVGFALRISNGKVSSFIYNTTNAVELNSSSTYNDGAWHHATLTYSGQNMSMYVDGTLANSSLHSGPVYYSPGGVAIARDGDAASSYFNGTIDSVRLWNRTLTQTEIQAEMASSRPVVRPIAAWEFDEGSGTVANDTHVWVVGKYGNGASFDGSNDYVYVNDSQNLRGMKNLTIYVWAKINSYNLYSGIVGKWSSGQATRQHYILGYFSGGTLWFWVGNDSLTNDVVSTQPPLDKWVSLTAVFTSDQDLRIYYNGTLQSTQTASIPNGIGTGAQALLMGSYSSYAFNGTIDDVAIFNRSLSDSEIAEMYNSGLALGDIPRISSHAYVNISFELAPGSTYTLNLSSLGNASKITSVPFGTYLLRPSRYSQSVTGLTDRVFTCA